MLTSWAEKAGGADLTKREAARESESARLFKGRTWIWTGLIEKMIGFPSQRWKLRGKECCSCKNLLTDNAGVCGLSASRTQPKFTGRVPRFCTFGVKCGSEGGRVEPLNRGGGSALADKGWSGLVI